MTIKHYILTSRHKIKEVDLMTWAKWFETANRRVGKITYIDYEVSTVFLGLDHNWGEGPPILFETMVFKTLPDSNERGMDCYMARYATWDEAMAGHKRVRQYVANGIFTEQYSYEQKPTPQQRGNGVSN